MWSGATATFLLQYDVSAGLKHKTARSEEATPKNYICGRTNTEGQKMGVPCAFWGFGPFFLKRTIEGSNRYNCRHNPDSAARFCPFKRSRLALSEPRHTLKYSNVLLNFVFSVLALPSTASPKINGSQLPRRNQHDSLPVSSCITSSRCRQDFSSGGGLS